MIYNGTRANNCPTPNPVMKRKTNNWGMLTDPATTAVPIIDMMAPTCRALTRPNQSPVNPCTTAPNAAPAQKRALIAPRIDAVWSLLAA